MNTYITSLSINTKLYINPKYIADEDKMGWDDWVFGIATGGLYNAGKAAYNGYKKVTGIVDDVENAADQAGAAIAKIGDTFVELGDSAESLIDNLDDLLVVERLVPRSRSDLWDEEVERLDDLLEERSTLKARIDTLRGEIESATTVDLPSGYGVALQIWIIENVINGPMSWIFGGSNSIWTDLGGSGRSKVFKIFSLNSKIMGIEKEIHEILYNEPGILPTTVYNVKETIERFNTIEQPKIEDILDSVDENLVESRDILKEVKKLFVTENKVAIDIGSLPQLQLEKLELMESEYSILESSINKDWMVAKKFLDLKAEEQPAFIEMMTKTASPDYMRKVSLKEVVSSGEDLALEAKVPNVESDITTSSNVRVKKDHLTASTTASVSSQLDLLSSGVLVDGIGPNFSKATMQPNIMKMMSGFTESKYYAYSNKYSFQKAIIKQNEIDISKVKLKIDGIKYKTVEVPGVIPTTLSEIKEILERFNSEEQPRIEDILDSVNDNLVESKEVIKKVNSVLGWISDFTNKHKLLVKIASGVALGAVALTLVLIPILLIRLIIFGL